jgi:L-2-hydroxyglutarate oxidase LhgO
MSTAESESPDVVLIGAGIMSATLGSVLKELEPALDVVMFETLQDCAQESSQAWNNAGTGHAANCELDVAKEDWGLAEYLIGQVLQTGSHQLKVLEQFYPEAQRQDWREAVAGQRVQIIKPGPHHSGSLEFGTEVVGSTDNSIVALLGASPGASTAAYIAFETPEKCFAKERAGGWRDRLMTIIPTYGIDLTKDAAATRETRAQTAAVLGLTNV